MVAARCATQRAGRDWGHAHGLQRRDLVQQCMTLLHKRRHTAAECIAHLAHTAQLLHVRRLLGGSVLSLFIPVLSAPAPLPLLLLQLQRCHALLQLLRTQRPVQHVRVVLLVAPQQRDFLTQTLLDLRHEPWASLALQCRVTELDDHLAGLQGRSAEAQAHAQASCQATAKHAIVASPHSGDAPAPAS